MIQYVDCLIGNEEDFQKVLGFEVEGVDEENLKALDTSAYKKMVERVVAKYPNIKVVGTTLREVKSGLVNNWSAILWHEGQFYESRRFNDLEIEDRVGGGDGFALAVSPTASSPACPPKTASTWAPPTARCSRRPAAIPARSPKRS